MKRIVAGVCIAALAIAGCKDKKELHIYGWPDYIAPQVISAFEEAYNCHVHLDTFDSNETMLEHLRANDHIYDVINPSSYHLDQMVKEGLVIELDHSKLPNVFANFDKSFIDLILDKEFKYSVPYAESYTGICYLKSKVPSYVDVGTWNVFDNLELRGKITLLDDIREVLCAGLIACGYSVNSVNPEEIWAAVDKVHGWMEHSRKFDAESYKYEVPSGATWVAHGYSFDSNQVIHGDKAEGIAPRKDVGFVLPREGFPVTFDVLVISSEAQEPELAYAFINFMYEPKNALSNMEHVFGPMAVKPALQMLKKDIKDLIMLDEETLKRAQLIKPISEYPGAMELYENAWRRIREAE